ncbi:hypothetical protein BAU18_000184 [Enterococcus diestrammenae]|uniref:Uncharacterized protein n=1 Tax=Enterococcus diestrammenae TaxID=1155073 RepID=A0ABV0EXW8_9ENTE
MTTQGTNNNRFQLAFLTQYQQMTHDYLLKGAVCPRTAFIYQNSIGHTGNLCC